jgi:VWFA-related protein
MYSRSCWKHILLTATMICVSSALGQTPAVEQQPANAAPAQPIPVLHMTSNLVLLDVVVTNKGKAVHGLERSKFHLFEDGHEQTIVNFDEHQPGAVPAVLHAPPVLPPHIYSNKPYYPATDVVNVLLLDALNTPQTDQMRMRQQMIEYMGKIQPGTMMAVFTLTSRLRMVTGFTTDVAQLAKTVKDQKSENPNMLDGPTAPDPLDALQDYNDSQGKEGGLGQGGGGAVPMNSSSISPGSLNAKFEADVANNVLEARIRITLDAMKQLGLYLSAIPGRKNLIWFSGSIPAALDPNGSAANSAQDIVAGYLDDVRKTNNLLAAARVAVYPVDTRGMMTPTVYDVSYGGTGEGVVLPSQNAGPLAGFAFQLAADHDAMRQIAEQTGGQAYLNNGLKEAVASAVENGSSYYTITYTPTSKKFDSRYHKIEVRLDQSGDQLNYRRGYYGDAPVKSAALVAKTMTPFLAATVHGAPPATQVLFQARVLPASDPQFAGAKLPDGHAGEMTATLKGGTHRYVADLVIDAHTLDLEKTPDGLHQVAIECVVVGYDDGGNRLNWEDATFTVALRPEQYAGILATGLPLRMQLDLPAGREYLRVAVKDVSADHSGSLEVPVAVAAK